MALQARQTDCVQAKYCTKPTWEHQVRSGLIISIGQDLLSIARADVCGLAPQSKMCLDPWIAAFAFCSSP
jgi:hypothetical protein